MNGLKRNVLRTAGTAAVDYTCELLRGARAKRNEQER